MSRYLSILLVLGLSLTLFGCGDSNPIAPPDNQPHSSGWISSHPVDALASADFADCTGCHGSKLQGNDDAISCYACHAFNTTPPFTIHPATWPNPYINHRGTKSTDTCANCHGSDLLGSLAAPSCFSSDFNGLSCHATGPGLAPHPLDGTYLLSTNHGPEAKLDLTVCQACHGQAGGPGSNPRFNLGIESQGGTGCEACHGINLAHPAKWEGYDGPTFHGIAGNMANACALCHGIDLNGGVGPSCIACHGRNPLN